MDFGCCFILTLAFNLHRIGLRFEYSESEQNMAKKSSRYGNNQYKRVDKEMFLSHCADWKY